MSTDGNVNSHDRWFDDIAVYALGSMPAADAARVRSHLRDCEACQKEYAFLAPAATALAYSTMADTNGKNTPQVSALLKARIMREVRASTKPAVPVVRAKPIVWPAYLVAAACFAIALISTMANISLTDSLRQTQTQLASVQDRADSTDQRLANEHVMLNDLMSGDAKRYVTKNGGEVVTRGDRLYIAMHDMPMPPHGKTYQAWTMPKGGKTVAPSVTFMPDKDGDAMIALPEDARNVTMIAVSLEPEGGSKAPTSKPMAVVELN